MSSNFAPPQIIDGAYIDQVRLMCLLNEVYGTKDGKNNFKVEVGIALLLLLYILATIEQVQDLSTGYAGEYDEAHRIEMSSISATPQIIDGGYVDQRRLMDLLKDIYGTKDGQNNFKVEVHSPRTTLLIIYMAATLKSVQNISIQHRECGKAHRSRTNAIAI
ncbi:hypothetical protein CJF31_00004691 [Rutstroemia sp. NJR-2017a BVV2]|nr:hypothetical protein CJF31_00004691 [Rutstroemia sp. NJR-2017a BVV2]